VGTNQLGAPVSGAGRRTVPESVTTLEHGSQEDSHFRLRQNLLDSLFETDGENNMVRVSWKMKVALILALSSGVLSLVHTLVFHDAGTLFFYLAEDLVFVPFQVLLVTIIIEQLLNEREKRAVLNKLNMVIGAFFSEVGGTLIRHMAKTCADFSELQKQLSITSKWSEIEYKTAMVFIENHQCRFDSEKFRLDRLRGILVAKRVFILGLLQNPNLLEHERFTDLLWAICHLTEELTARENLDTLPPADLEHLEGDIQRAFGLLTREWLNYMEHLRVNYPYMYSLALRTNPFNPKASAIVGPGV
jgi:hypothetical protein